MTRSAYRMVLTIGMAAFVVAGCASVRTGSAIPGPTDKASTTGAAASPDDTTAPRVPAPLSLAALTSEPCSLLMPTQLGMLGFSAAATTTQPESDSLGVGCAWDDTTVGTGAQMSVDLLTPLHHGLADIYRQRNTAAYWTPVTVAGYPGVLTDTVDERSTGTCRMDVGATNTDVIDLGYQGPSTSQPCRTVQKLAAAVVARLKGSS